MRDHAEEAQPMPAGERLANLFTDHPHSVGESYFQHLRSALGFAGQFALCALQCGVHAVLPFCFTRSASARLQRLTARIARVHQE
ncbi:MAG: DUF6356 family protein [Pseudomonadota bacterium]